MNGRVYDPIIGRFLSADPIIQAPYNSQSYNRYSYVWNNPLSAVDPSGFVKDLPGVLSSGSGMQGLALSGAGSYCAYGDGGCSTNMKRLRQGQPFLQHGGSIVLAAMIRIGLNDSQLASLSLADTMTYFGASVGYFNSVQLDGSSWSDRDAAAAGAANAVYGDNSGGLLGAFGIPYAPTDGFAASLTLGSKGMYFLAFRGTFFFSLDDWGANFGQATFGHSSQFDQAIALATDVFRATHGNVIFVGHSLGGALAAAAAYATSGSAITFNAAGLHSNYRVGTPSSIRAHYITGDILTMFQQLTPFPNAAGTQISHSAPWYCGPLCRHSMSNFP